MTGLLRSELRRIWHRRIGRIFAIVFLAITVLVLGRIAMVSERLDQDDLVRIAAQETREQQAECRRFRDTGSFGGPSSPDGQILPSEDFCDQIEITPDQIADRRLSAKDALPAGVRTVASFASIIALVLGASFIGAEWNHGTLQALLFWEPRRTRVLAAKAVALVAGVVGVLLVLNLVVYVGLYAIAATRGTTEGATAGLHISNLLTVLRSAVAVSFVGLLAFAISGLSRYTAAALGVFGGYFFLIENLIRGLRPGWQRFLVGENTAAIVGKSIEVAPAGGGNRMVFDGFEPQMYTLTAARGVLTLGIYVALALAAFYFTFTRRDVT